MATTVIMPRQGQSVESCILTGCKKKGERVHKGELLFSYETDKASFEEFAPVDGLILEFYFNEGDEVPVLTNVCVIGEEGERVEAVAPATIAEVKEEKVSDEAKPQVQETTIYSGDAAVSPRARTLAEKEGVSLIGVSGSGPGGRIIEQDVKNLLTQRSKIIPQTRKMTEEEKLQAVTFESEPGGPVKKQDMTVADPGGAGDFEVKKLTEVRKLIAKAMYQSLQNSAQLTHHLGADARQILALRKIVKQAMDSGYPTNITLNDMICFAVVKALKKFPQVNSHFLGDSMKYFRKIHLGVAVDTDRGLMVPVIRDADELSIQELSEHLHEAAIACRNGNISPDLLSSEAASFTVTNLGSYGVEIFTPVINLPQTAILGVNTIILRPKDLGDGVYGFVPYLGLSLTYNHQALDGGEATRFLKQIATEIENLDFKL